MKNLKQILPLYLGQEIKEGNQYYKILTVGEELIKVQVGKTIGMNTLWKYKILANNPNINLLLRPLSSMTKEEAREICEKWDLVFKSLTQISDSVLMDTDFGVIGLEAGGVITFQEPIVFYNSLIPHLCALGFDCFNLIGQGIAKDVTKIKN